VGEAVDWYRRAAAQHGSTAQVALERIDALGGGRSGALSKPRRKPGAPERRRDPVRWDKAAEMGDASARFHLGLMYEKGLGVVSDAQKSEVWYLASARQGDIRAQLALARLYEGTNRDLAVDWYRRAADLGSPDAQFALGRYFCAGTGGARDFFQGVSWYLKAGEQGDLRALMTVGQLCVGGPLEHLAVECFKKAAAMGDAEAQFLIGQHLAAGKGAAQDLSEAVEWWHRAALQGYAQAQCALAGACLRGKGTPTDFQQAFGWFQKAAEQGDVKAQWNLGAMYASGGEGVAQDMRQAFAWCHSAADLDFVPAQATLGVLFARIKDPVQAVFWWEKAAQQGDPEAQYNLANMYSKGQGVERDGRLAFQWFARAAAQGVASAQSKLGLLYAVGDGVTVDPIEAHKWFLLAANAGDAVARANLARSRARLTVAQVEEAERRASLKG
jgi:TPR repeat protein